MKRLATKMSVLCALLGPTLGSEARADAFQSLANQRNTLPGGKAALLGGAFTAVASDSSASYYNPAGLALIKDDRFDLSATSYRASQITYHDAINAAPFNERSEVTYPSFVGATIRLGRFSFGYSYMTLDANNIYQQDDYADISTEAGAPSSYNRTYQERSTYILGGGSGAFRLSDSLSLGVSAFYYQRNLEYSTHELVQLNGGGIVTINSTMQTLNTGITGVYGFLWRRPSYSLGASIRRSSSLSDRSVMLSDTVEYDQDASAVGADGGPVPTVTSTSRKANELNELNPPTYVLGGALHPWPRFLLSADVLLHEGVSNKNKADGGADLETTLNYSLGMSLKLGPVEMITGYFTNNSMYRRPDPSRSDQPIYINYTGHSGGLSLDFGNFDGYLGGVRQLGQGEAQIRNDDPKIQDVDASSVTYMIAGNLVI